jgi:hypothetical protein
MEQHVAMWPAVQTQQGRRTATPGFGKGIAYYAGNSAHAGCVPLTCTDTALHSNVLVPYHVQGHCIQIPPYLLTVPVAVVSMARLKGLTAADLQTQ